MSSRSLPQRIGFRLDFISTPLALACFPNTAQRRRQPSSTSAAPTPPFPAPLCSQMPPSSDVLDLTLPSSDGDNPQQSAAPFSRPRVTRSLASQRTASAAGVVGAGAPHQSGGGGASGTVSTLEDWDGAGKGEGLFG